MAGERPQRAVSAETQQRIAARLDEAAEWAEKNGYRSESFREQAQRYRAATGQTGAGEATG